MSSSPDKPECCTAHLRRCLSCALRSCVILHLRSAPLLGTDMARQAKAAAREEELLAQEARLDKLRAKVTSVVLSAPGHAGSLGALPIVTVQMRVQDNLAARRWMAAIAFVGSTCYIAAQLVGTSHASFQQRRSALALCSIAAAGGGYMYVGAKLQLLGSQGLCRPPPPSIILQHRLCHP